MAFFGSHAPLARDRGHPSAAPGFGQAQDPFAGLSQSRGHDADEDDDDDA